MRILVTRITQPLNSPLRFFETRMSKSEFEELHDHDTPIKLSMLSITDIQDIEKYDANEPCTISPV